MLKNLLNYYKLPLLISLTTAVVLAAIQVIRDPLQIAFLVAGALAGTFFLDLDYILHAYILDPDTDFSKTIKGYIHHRDIKGLIGYIFYHRAELKQKTLNSAIFQVVLAGACILVAVSNVGNFSKAFVFATFVNSLYKLAEEHLQNKNVQEWFWAFKVNVDKRFLIAYSSFMLVALIFSLYLL